jgi:hypothetical protein
MEAAQTVMAGAGVAKSEERIRVRSFDGSKKRDKNAKAFLPSTQVSLVMRLQIFAGTVASPASIQVEINLRTGRQRWNAGATGDFLSSKTNHNFVTEIDS